MEPIKDLVPKIDRYHTPASTQYSYAKNILKIHNLIVPDETIVKYADRVMEYAEIRAICIKCQGRDTCGTPTPGFALGLEYDHTCRYISTPMIMCEKEQAERQKKRINRLLASSRLPAELAQKTFANFQVDPSNQEAYESARMTAEDIHGRGIVFVGDTGTGKSHLAAAIANYRLQKGNEAIFVVVPELIADIRRVIKSEETTSELFEIVKNTELLILDDLGTERMTDWVMEQLYMLINARMLKQNQTIVTTNYMPDDLLLHMSAGSKDDLPGRRIISRLSAMCEWVELKGEDRRITG